MIHFYLEPIATKVAGPFLWQLLSALLQLARGKGLDFVNEIDSLYPQISRVIGKLRSCSPFWASNWYLQKIYRTNGWSWRLLFHRPHSFRGFPVTCSGFCDFFVFLFCIVLDLRYPWKVHVKGIPQIAIIRKSPVSQWCLVSRWKKMSMGVLQNF